MFCQIWTTPCPLPKSWLLVSYWHVINYSPFRFVFCMVGADPERRLRLCELVCLHKHTHTYTHLDRSVLSL